MDASCCKRLTFVVLVILTPTASLLHCHKGEFLKKDIVLGRDSCESCKNGFYMDRDFHRKTECAQCDRPVYGRGKIEKKPCTRWSNVEVGCDQWHYRNKKRGKTFHCKACKNCTDFGEVEVVACIDDKDTICVTNEIIRLLCSAQGNGHTEAKTSMATKHFPVLTKPHSKPRALPITPTTVVSTQPHNCYPGLVMEGYVKIEVLFACIGASVFIVTVMVIAFCIRERRKRLAMEYFKGSDLNLPGQDGGQQTSEQNDPFLPSQNPHQGDTTAQPRYGHHDTEV